MTCSFGRFGARALAVGAALLAMVLPLPGAWAADITFKVPVNLSDLHPDVEAARVSCRVDSKAGMATGSTEVGPPIGGKIQREAIVTVSLDSGPTKFGGAAKWICVLALVAKGVSPHAKPVPSYTHPLLPLRARTGTPLVTQVEGVLNLPASK
ncbi:MAG: hypothetical protein L0214_08950 [candidate division NC10 bacterium]|nr:hypothetical protein [candidate division NC10 bacterium]